MTPTERSRAAQDQHRRDTNDLAHRHRAALVRVVVARDWAVAIAMVEREPEDQRRFRGPYHEGLSDGYERAMGQVMDLPCAADVIADLLGDAGDLVARGGA